MRGGARGFAGAAAGGESAGAPERCALRRARAEERVTSTGKQDEQSLARSLSRTRAALARTSLPGGTRQAPRPGPAASALGVAALALFVLAFATGQHWLLALALIFAAGGAALFVVPAAQQILLQLAGHGSPGQTHVGMGATVAADAVLEPGASVEMGATVGPRAVVRSGAVVRM